MIAELKDSGNDANSALFSLITVSYFDQEFLVSGSNNGSINVWNIDSQVIIKRLKSNNSGIWALASFYVGDKLKIASGSKDSIIKIIDFNQMSIDHILYGHQHPIKSLFVIKQDNNPLNNIPILISGCNKDIIMWNPVKGYKIRQINAHKGDIHTITTIKFNNKKYIMSASRDGFVIIWNPTNGKQVKSLSKFRNSKSVSIININEKDFIITASNNSIKIWNPINENLIDTIAVNEKEHFFNLKIIQLGTKIVLVGANGKKIRVWS